MLKIIDIGSDVLSSELAPAQRASTAGWIIKKDQIAGAQRAGDLISHARHRADMLVEEARQHAKEDREEGFRQGLQAGIQAALSPVFDLLRAVQALRQEAREDASVRLRAAMEDLLGRTPTLEALVDTVLEAHLPQTPSLLRIRVPALVDVEALKAHCGEQGIDVRIDAAQAADVFSIAWEGHLWEVLLDNLCGPSRVGGPGSARTLPDEDARALCRQALLAEAQRLT